MLVIINLFAILGLIFIVISLCDFFFYRKCSYSMPLILDVRKKSESELIDMLEIITTIRRSQIGKCAITKLIVLTEEEETRNNQILKYYMETFLMKADYYILEEEHWKKIN